MLGKEPDDILTVLAVGVFADKRIFSSEIQVFISSVSNLELSDLDLPKISGAKALTWFEMNKQTIQDKFEGPRSEFDAWFVPILERVGEYVDKEKFLKQLDDIFIADDEIHISETAMRVLVERVWGVT